jgi:hypothetical protein
VLRQAGAESRRCERLCGAHRRDLYRLRRLWSLHATANADPGQGLGHALAGLGATFEVLSALRTYFDKLSDVAPPTIEDQAKIVAKSYDDQLHDEASQAGDPLGALMSGLLDGAEYSSQLNDMNQFALQHCGHSV